MLELFAVIFFCWLLFKVLKLTLKVAWSAAKITASVLLGLACPLLILCLVFSGGMALVVPLAMIALAFGLLKKCV